MRDLFHHPPNAQVGIDDGGGGGSGDGGTSRAAAFTESSPVPAEASAISSFSRIRLFVTL